jgi:2-polyprenyl-6-methoxyphenol hydroxylase-like FAD-dependent oxidoreductase
MSVPSILVVGAGPTGMTAAIELKRAGLDVRIIDKRDHLSERSQALALQARTLEQFQSPNRPSSAGGNFVAYGSSAKTSKSSPSLLTRSPAVIRISFSFRSQKPRGF